MLIQAMNKNLNLQRYKVLYVSGNYSGILSKPDRRLTELEVRRGFTVFPPAVDPFLEDLMKNTDRVFYFDEGPRAAPRMIARALPKTQKDHTMLEAFS